MSHPITRKDVLRLGAGALAAPFVLGSARAGGRPVVLRLSTPDAISHPNTKVMQQFGDLIAKRTENSVKLQIFPDGQLGTMANAVSGVQMGTIDMAMTGPTMFETAIPRMGVFSLPFLFRDAPTAERVIDSNLGQSLMSQTEHAGAYVLACSTWGWRETETVNRIIREPADFEGLKLRLAPGPIGAMTFKTLGAIPTTIDASELYVAASQGTVDGFEVPFLSLVASKYYEVIKHCSLTNHAYNPVWAVVSKHRMDSLSPDQQKVIRSTALELQPSWRALAAASTEDARKFLEGKGIDMTATDYPAFRKKLAVVYDWFKQRTDPAFVQSWASATET